MRHVTTEQETDLVSCGNLEISSFFDHLLLSKLFDNITSHAKTGSSGCHVSRDTVMCGSVTRVTKMTH